MLRRVLLLASLCGLVVACGDHDDWGYAPSEALFAIEQRTDAAGTKQISAGYELLGLANRRSWGAEIFRDGDGEGTCYYERLGERLGRARVDDGVAVFGGGRLPAPGIQVLANQPDAQLLGAEGWSTNERLTFDVRGFALPRIQPFVLRAPRSDLQVTAVVPAANGTAIALRPSDDVGVTWTPPADPDDDARVMVVLRTSAPDPIEVRCFGSGRSDSIVLPSRWVAQLFSAVDPALPITGHLTIASHRQVTTFARGDWTVYVVATTVHSDQSFTGTR